MHKRKEKNDSSSWMTDEIKDRLRLQDEIVKNQDIKRLFLLNDNAIFSCALLEILTDQYNKNPHSLNQVKLDLMLCMHLENAGQANSILSFLQEWFPDQNEQVVKSLNTIGASKSANIIKQAIKLLPKDGTLFFKFSNEESEEEMMKLDIQFSDYPDGSMNDLYRKYAEDYKKHFT